MVLKVVAVTGATGMLGRHVTAALREYGFRVVPISRRRECTNAFIWDLAQWKSQQELDELLDGIDAIVHAGAAVPRAGITPCDRDIFDVNVRSCVNLAEWARKREKPMIYVSGAIVYKNPNSISILETAPLGQSGFGGLYGMTKLLAEDVLRREEQNGMKLAVVRPSSIYGSGLSSGKMLKNFLETAAKGDAIELDPPVDDRIDFIHAADVASAIVRILQTGSWDTFNLGSGSPSSIIELAEICVLVAGRGEVKVKSPPGSVSKMVGDTRFGMNCAHARRRLGWEPQVRMSDGIRALLNESILCNVNGAR